MHITNIHNVGKALNKNVLFVICTISFGSQRRRSHFSLPVLPYFPCLLSSIVWSIERLSLHCSSNWEIMDLINWSLNAIDTIWRYLPIRNHDNRSSADWIRLCPGLSKNSENGNSCPKHKAAHMTEAVGRAVSIETETIIAIWILSRRSSRLCREKLMIETEMDRESSCFGMRLLA